MDEITSFFKVKRNIVNTLLLLVMVAALPLGINLARQQQILRSRAGGETIKFIGNNVEKRNDKWVALDRNKSITLELISSLGAPGGSGSSQGGSGGSSSGGSGGTGNPDGAALQNSTFQSLVPNGITAEQITAEANQIIGSGNWKTEENQFKLRRNLFEKYFGHEGEWLTPQQIAKFKQTRTDIGEFINKRSEGGNADGVILGEWFPGGSRDTDGLRILLQIAREDNGKPITTPDQVLAMVGIKERMITEMGGPEGSRDWPATRFLRAWFKGQDKNNPDQNAINALRIMSKMPGQTGFTLQEYPNIPQAFTQTTSLPNLMSLIPKGLVGTVYAQLCTEGYERFECSGQQAGCPVGQGERIKYLCKADLIFGDRTDWEYDSSYCDPECGDSGGGSCNQCPSLADICEGNPDGLDNGCGQPCVGIKKCGGGSSCTPDCSQEPNACSGEIFGDGCGGTCVGSKDCGVGGIVFCPGYNQISDTGKLQWCSRGSIPPYGTDGKDCGWHPTLTEGCVDVDTGGNPPPGEQTKVCNAGEFRNPPYECTKQRAGCDANAGEALIYQCKSDGSGFEPTYSECHTACKSATTQPPGDKPPGAVTKPPASTKPSGSPATSGAPKTSGAPSGSPGTGTVTTVSYKIAETPDELSSAPENPYTGEPMIVNFDFKDKTPGNKFIWVEYKDSKGKTARHSAQIRLLGDDPKIGSCFLTFEGQNALVIITNPTATGSPTFGKEKGSVQSGSSTLQIKEWTDKFVSAVISNIAPGTSVPITLTTADGQKADAQCGSISGLSLGAKVFCRAPQKHDTDNVDMTISEATPGASVARQKVRVDKDGNVQNLQTKLIEGRKYKVSLKAPRSLKRTVEFTAGEGITNLQNFVLPVGDIFPLESGDGKINSLDKAELNRQWVTAQSVSGRSGDFNQDTRINSIDWACMRYDFGKSDD